MSENSVRYLIVGGGAAAASAIDGIRERDPDGSIRVLSRDNHPPYQRPPLSKGLWFGKQTLDQLPIHPDGFYAEKNVELQLRREAVELDPESRRVWDERGVVHGYDELLLATGGRPRLLDAPGSTLEGVHYFRYLEDYLFLRGHLDHFEHVLIVGGGFIGMEMAAALNHAGKQVTIVYPEEYPLRRVLPRDLGLFVADYYRERGIEVISGESISAIEELGGALIARTHSGNHADTQLLLVGVGITPHSDLAEAAGIEVHNGIVVDEFGRTSAPHVWAAGDVAEFPYVALDRRARIEHWDHALAHGRAVGANMAGANRPYDQLPLFYSDLFDLGWEAVGEVDSSLVVEEVWREPFKEGVLFYLNDEVVRGVLLWNRWGLADWARDLIRAARPMTVEERARAIPPPEG
jgi:NADPH-dependent 2,4-dienoyl-CoA reductase/sulfur reductase-like enzyme